MSTVVEQIRQRAEATHLDYPHSRAVSDVTILLAEVERLQKENEALRTIHDIMVSCDAYASIGEELMDENVELWAQLDVALGSLVKLEK